MPIVKCKCGYWTNTAVAEHVNAPEGFAERCYARIKGPNEWIPGCAYRSCPKWMKGSVDSVIARSKLSQ